MSTPVRSVLVRWLVAALPCLSACARHDTTDWAEVEARVEGGRERPAADSAEAGRGLEAAVVVEPARDGDLILWVHTTGVVRSASAITLRAELAGTLTSIAVREGERVQGGAPIASLEAEPFDLVVREAEARLAEAEQRMADSYVPDSVVTGQPLSVEQRMARQRRAGVLSARVAVDRARRDRGRVVLRSPIDGIVNRLHVGRGEQVGVGQPVVQVVDATHLIVEAEVLEHDLPHIRTGARVRLRTVADSGQLHRAHVTAVLPTIDTVTHAGRVLIRLPATGPLRPGMTTAVDVEGVRVRRRRLVPTRAILERDGRSLVFVLHEGRAQWTYVIPGRSNGVETELLPDAVSGALPLPAGAPVLVEGHQTLTHEAPVRVMPAGRGPPP